MNSPYQFDQAWFDDHPREQIYQRAPLPEEWQNCPVPQDAFVTVYFITGRCTVRVLKRPDGQKVATVLDSEDALYMED